MNHICTNFPGKIRDHDYFSLETIQLVTMTYVVDDSPAQNLHTHGSGSKSDTRTNTRLNPTNTRSTTDSRSSIQDQCQLLVSALDIKRAFVLIQ